MTEEKKPEFIVDCILPGAALLKLATAVKAGLTPMTDILSFKVSKTGIFTRINDTTNIKIAEVRIPAAVFLSIDVEGEQLIAVDAKDFAKLLSKFGSLPAIRFSTRKNENFLMISDGADGRKRVGLGIYQASIFEKDIHLQDAFQFKASLQDLIDALSLAEMMDETRAVLTIPDESHLVLDAKSHTKNASSTIDIKPLTKFIGPVRVSFQTEFLTEMTKKFSWAKEVIISCKTDFPLLMEATDEANCFLKLIVAPYIGRDDEVF
jgi:hypothetical protein